MGLLFDVSSCRLCVPGTDLLDFEDHVRKLVKVCERGNRSCYFRVKEELDTEEYLQTYVFIILVDLYSTL